MQAYSSRNLTYAIEVVGPLSDDDGSPRTFEFNQIERCGEARHRRVLGAVGTIIAPSAQKDELTEQSIKTVAILIATFCVNRIEGIGNRALILAPVGSVVVQIDITFKTVVQGAQPFTTQRISAKKYASIAARTAVVGIRLHVLSTARIAGIHGRRRIGYRTTVTGTDRLCISTRDSRSQNNE